MKLKPKTIENDEAYLRQKSQPVDFRDPELNNNLEVLTDFCKQTACFALAAVQIGIPKRLIYLKNSTLTVSTNDLDYDEHKILFNPVILRRTGLTEYWEACVSCLNKTGLVRRPYKIEVEYQDLDGQIRRECFSDFAATVLSHEIDHLDGILHLDIATEILVLTPEERQTFRKTHPYKIIRKTGDFLSLKKMN